MSMDHEMFNLKNRPMISQDIIHVEKSTVANDLFSLVDRYAKENMVILNGGYLANNLTDGKNHITTAPIYRLWEYLSLMELVGIVDLDTSSAKKIKILDCGGCSSAIDFYLAERGFQVVSVDLNDFLVFNGNHIAKKKQLPLENIKADFTQLPFEDNNFDIVFSISVLEHIDKKVRVEAIQEMERVVKPGGFIFNTFDYGGYIGKEEMNYNIPHKYRKHEVIQDVNEILELVQTLKESKVVGNLITGDLRHLPRIAPNHDDFIMHINLKRCFNAFSNYKDVMQWFVKFIMFKLSPKTLRKIYRKTEFYNFFRIVMQKN